MSANRFTNPEGNKPEWFSLVESDTRVQKNPRHRGIRIMALAGPLLLVSAGLLFAQTTEKQNAVATESTSVSAPSPSSTSELASSGTSEVGVATDPVATTSKGSSSVAVSSENSINSELSTNVSAPPLTRSSSSTKQPATTNSKIANPAIGQGFVPPAPNISQASSLGDDDDEGDDD